MKKLSISIRHLIGLSLGALSPCVWAAAEPITSISSAELTRVAGGLLLVLLLILALSWLVKRLHGVQLSSSKGFATIASMTLGPKERIMLVKVGVRYLLLGVGSGSVSTLCDFGEQLPQGFEPGNASSFSLYLKSALGKS